MSAGSRNRRLNSVRVEGQHNQQGSCENYSQAKGGIKPSVESRQASPVWCSTCFWEGTLGDVAAVHGQCLSCGGSWSVTAGRKP